MINFNIEIVRVGSLNLNVVVAGVVVGQIEREWSYNPATHEETPIYLVCGVERYTYAEDHFASVTAAASAILADVDLFAPVAYTPWDELPAAPAVDFDAAIAATIAAVKDGDLVYSPAGESTSDEMIVALAGSTAELSEEEADALFNRISLR